MANDRITQRLYIKGDLLLTSPLVLGSGEDENTDIDILRDWDGKPLIPGTSLAGAIRHFLRDNFANGQPLADRLFGEQGKHSKQSLVILHDLHLKSDQEGKVLIRDGVKLDRVTKTVVTSGKESKYDYEILDAGRRFELKIEVIRRDNSDIKEKEFLPLIGALLSNLTSGRISVGAKTRRGYGQLQLENENILLLDMSNPDDVNKWIDFEWKSFEGNKSVDKLDDGTHSPNSNTYTINSKFNIPCSILIRHYSDKYRDVDHSHIQSNGNSVIPGTSWNGAIRHAAYQILLDLGAESKADTMMKDIFGFVDQDNKDAAASKIFIKESIIDDGKKLLKYTRNRVDRFTGGVVDSALFDEMPHYQGTVELNISLKKNGDVDDKWRLALIKMALLDIGHGIQPVGGAANIGRGILDLVGDIPISDDEYKALKNKLNECTAKNKSEA